MRNIFDQYEQPENRLTHALVCTLSSDRQLLRPFLKWLKVSPIPPVLRLVEQQVPGVAVSEDEADSSSLPDACIYNDDAWALLFESKVQASISLNPIGRHFKTAARHGYKDAVVVILAIERPGDGLPERTLAVEWRDVYRWFRKRARKSCWARTFVDYMQVFESRCHLMEGTLTMFDGLHFGESTPYTHGEGKRLIRLLRDELRQRKDLQELGVDPDAKGRSAITGRGFDSVWDFLPLKQARDAMQFTAYPHLTLGMNRETAVAAITVPNGVKGGFRTRLDEARDVGFRSLVAKLEAAIRPVLKQAAGAKPNIYVTQRHYPSLRSAGIVDGRLDADLRTLSGDTDAGVKRQPEWIDAIYALLTQKRSNIQFGVDVHFPYKCPVVRSPNVAKLFAETWLAFKPMLDFVLAEA